MGRIRRGWELTKKSWSVIRSHPGLVRFPIYGGLLALLFGVVFMVPGSLLLSTDDDNQGALIGGVLLIAIGAYLASFFVIYFNVALAAAADQALRGEQPDLRAARGVARSRIGVIAAWALVSAVVSAFFAVLRDRAGALGGFASAIGAAIWSLVTFLVVPVLAFEGIGPFDAIKRSAALFRQRWGQQVTGNLAIGGIAVLVTIVAVVIGVGGVALMASGSTGGEVTGGALLLVALVIGVAAAVFASATKGVFGVALYRYVADDATVGPFTAQDLERAAKPA
jgi:hypothetical protein